MYPVLLRWHQRRGRECRVPYISNSGFLAVQKACFSSVAILDSRLFSRPEKALRNVTGCSVETFEGSLNGILSGIPDEHFLYEFMIYRI